MPKRQLGKPWIRLALLTVVMALAEEQFAFADRRTDARRYFQGGMAAIQAGDYTGGVMLLKRAHALKPHPDVLFNIARAYVSLGDFAQAIAFFEQYLAFDTPDAAQVRRTVEELKQRLRLRLLVDEGMSAIEAGRYTEGVVLLKRAQAIRPHPDLLYNIGRAYEAAGASGEALTYYRQYLASHPADEQQVAERLSLLEARKVAQNEPREPSPSMGESKRRRRRTPAPLEPLSGDEAPEGGEGPGLVVSAEFEARLLERMGETVDARVREVLAEWAATEAQRKKVDSDLSVTTTTSSEALQMFSGTSTTGVQQDLAGPLAPKTDAAFDEVVVTASRRAQNPLDAPNAVTIITQDDIRVSGAQTIPDILRRVPGMDVMAPNRSDANVAVRGFNRRVANKVLVLIDGRTAYQDFLGGMAWSSMTIGLQDIERIEVVRGPGSAIYGAYAYTGIINIITKTPEQYHGSTLYGAVGNGDQVGASYSFGKRLDNFGVRLSVGYEQAAKYELTTDPNRIDYQLNSDEFALSFRNIRADGNVEYRIPGTRSNLYFGGGARTGPIEYLGQAFLRNLSVNGEQFSVRAGYESELFTLRTFWNGVRTSFGPESTAIGGSDLSSYLRNDVVAIEPVLRPTFELAGHHALILGAEYRFKYIDWNYLDDQHKEDHFALFFQDQWNITDQWSLIVSGRLDVHPIIGTLGSPRAALIFKPTPNQAIRLSIGTAFRQPTMLETYADVSASTAVRGVGITLGNDRANIQAERILSGELGYRYEAGFGAFEAVGFVNRLTNLIDLSPLQATGADQPLDPAIDAYIAARSRFVNQSRAYIAVGSEWEARLFPVEGLDIGLSYAFQHIFDEDSGDRFTNSPIHKVTLWGQVRTEMGIDVSLTSQFVSSQDWVEPTFDPQEPSGFSTDPIPLDGWVTVMARVGYRLLDDQLELAVSGTNLADFSQHRHQEHPFGNRLEARLLGSVTVRFDP
jgi:iron complex outermembrane recepter protein